MKLTTNAPDALAEAHRPWAAVIGVKRMIRTMIDGGFQAHAGVGADAAAVAGRDQSNLGTGAASLAVGILEAAPILAIVRAVGIEIGPDEGAGIAQLELAVDILPRRVGAALEGLVGAGDGC